MQRNEATGYVERCDPIHRFLIPGGCAIKPILVAYCTNAGSTTDVAAAIGEELAKSGAQVDVRGIGDVGDPSTYAGVVVGGPLIWSAWHSEAVDFVRRQQPALSQMPVAYFFTSLHLTQTAAAQIDSVPVYLDPALTTPPKRADRLSFTERHMTVDHYSGAVVDRSNAYRARSDCRWPIDERVRRW